MTTCQARPTGEAARAAREQLSGESILRAVQAACEEAGWDWESGPKTEDPTVPSPQACMTPIVRAALKATFPLIELPEMMHP